MEFWLLIAGLAVGATGLVAVFFALDLDYRLFGRRRSMSRTLWEDMTPAEQKDYIAKHGEPRLWD